MARRPPPNPFGPGGPVRPPFEGFGDINLPRPPRRFWIGLGFIGAAILIILIAAPLVGLITDWQWFDSLGFGGVYRQRLAVQLLLLFVGFLVALAFSLGNVLIALRLRSSGVLRAVGIRSRSLRTGVGILGLIVSLVLSLALGLALRGLWSDYLLYRNASPTGIRDPILHADVSFYMLQLPFLNNLQSWLVALVVVTTLLVLALHTWRGDHFDLRLPPRGMAHVSVLSAVVALLFAFGAWLGRYAHVYGHDSVIYGAGFTDVNARIPLATAQIGLAVLLAALLLVNAVARFRRGRVIMISAGVWIAGAIVVGAYPAVVQRVSVQPAELQQERPYIQNEIQFTRQAYGLNQVQTRNFGGDAPITSQDIATDQDTINNLRLWDYTPLQNSYQQLQSIRTYYTFQNIYVDRYRINGQIQQDQVSGRELDTSKLPAQAQTWTNQRLQYTHGYGIAASPVASVDNQGLPTFVAGNIPPSGQLQVTQPQIYFGQKSSDWAVAPSAAREFDYPTGSAGNAENNWQGTQAPQLSGANRLLWSMRTGDFNVLVSDQIQDRSRILYRRNVHDRVQEVAPFLTLDSNPYLVVSNGKLYWIQDAYVTSNYYPYSQSSGDQNYIRNSVKAVVNAYDGSVTLYTTNTNDPLIKAWQGAFPGMFTPLSKMPAGLQAHLRIPQDYFNIQANIYATYHMTDPRTFYNREDAWDMPVGPYYVLMRLPGESKAEYLMILPYTPRSKNNLVSWMAVRQDPPHYGQTVSFVLPKDKVVFGPQQVQSRINQVPEISQQYSLLNQQGSKVLKGNLLVVPIGNSFLYFQPWYLESSENQSLPQLRKVILTGSTSDSAVAYQDSLPQAISQLVGQTPPAANNGVGQQPSGQSGGTSAQLQQLVSQALDSYNKAQAALKQGDLATYAQQMQTTAGLLQQIQSLQQGQGASTSGAAASPQPSPSAAQPRASPSP